MPVSFRALALHALAGASLTAASRHARDAYKRQADATVDLGGKTCGFVEPGFDVGRAAAQAQRLSTHSWEFGAAAEALLELYSPEISVFGADPFPADRISAPPVGTTPGLLYARPKIKTNETTFDGPNGAAGDPASVGVMAVLMGQSEPIYMEASRRQADHLLNDVPRFWNGAISHREDVPELWADFMYMAPPFLAYYAVATNDEEMMEEAVFQAEAYRQIMHANTAAPTEGLWLHIVGPQSADLVLWSTGNAWAAGGMTRILATVQAWKGLSKRAELAARLEPLIKEILDGARGGDRIDGGLLRDKINDTTWWGEVSGTALLTATAYRAAVLAPSTFNQSYITWADENRWALAAHVNADGIAAPAVNPLNWFDREKFTSGSPEGQSFVVLVYAAYRDCVCAGVCEASQPPLGWTVPPSVPVDPVTSAAPTPTASESSSATASGSSGSVSVTTASSVSGSGSVGPTETPTATLSSYSSGSASPEPTAISSSGTISAVTQPTESTTPTETVTGTITEGASSSMDDVPSPTYG